MKHNAFGIFNSYGNANEAVHMLQAKGFTQENISLLTSDSTRDKVIGLKTPTKRRRARQPVARWGARSARSPADSLLWQASPSPEWASSSPVLSWPRSLAPVQVLPSEASLAASSASAFPSMKPSSTKTK
jgi:hypothetical protein